MYAAPLPLLCLCLCLCFSLPLSEADGSSGLLGDVDGSDADKVTGKGRLAPPRWWCNGNGSLEISLVGTKDVEVTEDEASNMDVSSMLSRNITVDDLSETSPPAILVSLGCGLLATCAMLFPCLQKKKKTKSFVSIGATSCSLSSSGEETSFSASTSKTFSTSSSHKHLLNAQVGTFDTSIPPGSKTFTLSELSKATKKFHPSCKIGQGGFGIVYKGKLQDGTVVAIKRAKKKIYDSRISTEFDNEVGMLLSIDHLNLVKMIGYMNEHDERILVVEYVPNGNLRQHLDGLHGITLNLSMRLDICIDVAHALTYLHMYAGKPIIHRDVKPSNILLTEKFRAKVADFGYSRMGPIEVGETHVSTEVKGTTGYLDPEYLKTFRLTEKSDVYSFGILLIEIITGRRPIDEKKDMKEKVALRWAFRKFLSGKAMEILDPKLERCNASCKVAARISELAFQCTAPTKLDRPTMKEVAETLWNVRKEYISFLENQGGRSPKDLLLTTESQSNAAA